MEEEYKVLSTVLDRVLKPVTEEWKGFVLLDRAIIDPVSNRHTSGGGVRKKAATNESLLVLWTTNREPPGKRSSDSPPSTPATALPTLSIGSPQDLGPAHQHQHLPLPLSLRLCRHPLHLLPA